MKVNFLEKEKLIQAFNNEKIKLLIDGGELDFAKASVKNCTDIYIYDFITTRLPKGAKILEIGGGNSRIIPLLSDDYEFWNVDKFEGNGNGPVKIENNQKKATIVKAYLGDFSDQIPSNYFDFVFSNSVLEHLPKDNLTLYNQLYFDTHRILKDDGVCLHCIDIFKLVYKPGFRTHPVVDYFKTKFKEPKSLEELHNEHIKLKDGMFCMSKETYNNRWFKVTKVPYESMGQPTSIQIEFTKREMSNLNSDNISSKQKNWVFLVYTMGKVGSSSIINYLKTNYPDSKSFHVHYLTEHSLKNVLPNSPFKHNIVIGEEVLSYLNEHPEKRVKIISLVRDPISRSLSSVFQNINEHNLNESDNSNILSIAKEGVDFYNHWFRAEFEVYTGLKILQDISFQNDKDYFFKRYDKFDLLFFKLEKLEQTIKSGMFDLIGENIQIDLSKKNNADSKSYHSTYKMMKNQLKFSAEDLTEIYKSEFVKNFYVPSEIDTFVSKWKD